MLCLDVLRLPLKAVRRRFSEPGRSALESLADLLAGMLVWIFLPLEGRTYREIRESGFRWFPQVDFARFRGTDILRVLIQLLWLALVKVRPARSRKRRIPERLSRSMNGLKTIRDRVLEAGENAAVVSYQNRYYVRLKGEEWLPYEQ